MSKDMKLIMESWRKNTLSEAVSFDTIGQVRAAVKGAIAAKKREITSDKAKQLGADVLMDLVPGSNIAKGFLGVIKAMYTLPDNKKTQTGLDYLNVDDWISKIVDDGIEHEFLNKVLDDWKGLPDSVPLVNVNMTKMLSKFIAGKYQQRTVKVPQQGN